MEDVRKKVYEALDKMNIKYEVVEHEPVYTMEDMDRLGLTKKGTLCKNLFLRDAKGKRHSCNGGREYKSRFEVIGKEAGSGEFKFCFRGKTGKVPGIKAGKRYALRTYE